MRAASPRRLLIVIYSMSGGAQSASRQISQTTGPCAAGKSWSPLWRPTVWTITSCTDDKACLSGPRRRKRESLGWPLAKRSTQSILTARITQVSPRFGSRHDDWRQCPIGFSGARITCAGSGFGHVHPPAFPLGQTWEWLRRSTYGLLEAVVSPQPTPPNG